MQVHKYSANVIEERILEVLQPDVDVGWALGDEGDSDAILDAGGCELFTKSGRGLALLSIVLDKVGGVEDLRWRKLSLLDQLDS